jgi:hypothetical protein
MKSPFQSDGVTNSPLSHLIGLAFGTTDSVKLFMMSMEVIHSLALMFGLPGLLASPVDRSLYDRCLDQNELCLSVIEEKMKLFDELILYVVYVWLP